MKKDNANKTDGSVSDVNAADVTHITPGNAAALASANFNSGTDCATISDTTMNIDTNTNDGIALASNGARATDPNAPRSESNSWYITVPECDSATISVVLGADDLGSVSVGPISLVLGPRGQYGGGTYTEVSKSASIVPGTYKVSTTYCNITLPEGIPNIARFRCDITLNVDGEEIVPAPVDIPPVDHEDEGEDETCPQTCDIQNPQPDCGCDKDENGAGDNGEPESGAGCGGNAGASGGAASAVAMTVDTDGEATTMTSSSGAGRKVTVRGGLQDMLWRMNFATFRGMAGIPDGALEIRAREFTTELCTPAALSFNHPFDTQVLASGGTSEKTLNGAFQIRSGSSRVNYFCFADGLVSPLAGSAKRGGKGNMLRATNAARNTVTRSLNLQDKRGGVARYDADDDGNMNMLSAYTTKSGRTYESADISSTLQVVRDGDGAIAQLWNAWDGLMVVDSVTETGYRMAFYLPHQVGAQNTETKLFAVSGSPWRTVEVVGNIENATLQMTDTVLTREPQVSRFIYGTDGAWSTEQGSGTAKICRHVARELIEQEDEDAPEQYRLVTTLHRGDINSPDECVAEIWQKGATGHLCISRTLGYGSPGALTTLYEYDSEGRRIKEISPSGAVSSFTYDDCGREMVRMTPYHGNHTLAVYTYYREENSADPDISYRRAVLNETATQVWREDFTYEEQDGYRRVTKSTQALGCTEPRVEITETWLDTAEESLCRGRLRMRQGMDGVQTWYSYEACSDFGAVYKVTAETRANGEAVPAHSRRDVTYISAVGNNMRHEVYRLLSNGTWALTESESYEYDCENNWVKRTRGNGRVTTRTMMCCGPLSVTDEDGVTTTYGYNAAHQLEEVIREEILEDGVVITPETITTYTSDAADRVLTERKDIGAMTTIETTQYDMLGREVSRTDALGRTTTTAYSEDGLSTTVTTPASATLISTLHADGSLAAVGGTGQRALIYEYGVQDSLLCTTVRLADEVGTLLSQTLSNGFGQTVQQVQPTTTEAMLSSISEYNAKGQLVKQWQSTGDAATAPTLYEYDSFGNVVKQTLALAEEPSRTNSPITELAYALEETEEGIFFCRTQTRYNAAGGLLVSVQKQLISQLLSTLAEKVIVINERGLSSADWVVYNNGAKRTRYSSVPTSNITAEAVTVDGFDLSQKDTAGIVITATRSFTAGGMLLTQTDGRGNATTTVTDIANRTLSVTDAAENVTSTAYDSAHDLPAVITDAQGNTTCYRYDSRGRKVAEWGTAMHPACFGYDEADNMTTLRTFRAGTETISTDPSERTDGDETTWSFDSATGLELRKTYADNSSVVKTYDSFNRLATETDARGNVKTHCYETARGLLLGTSYSDSTAARSYTYNHLGQLTQVTDDAGVRTFDYNTYGELETDSLLAGGIMHIITETRDAMGRSAGFTYSKNGSVQHTVTT
ncbi:MAG: RHS repeat protein, partial [Akkermansia sp.]|nr:RHS repeat protein [Akkermansia sp.]